MTNRLYKYTHESGHQTHKRNHAKTTEGKGWVHAINIRIRANIHTPNGLMCVTTNAEERAVGLKRRGEKLLRCAGDQKVGHHALCLHDETTTRQRRSGTLLDTA